MPISSHFKLWATQVFPPLRKLGSRYNGFILISIAQLDYIMATICHGEQSTIILTGCHSCGILGIQIKDWGEGLICMSAPIAHLEPT
jgi:hypothetical protein